MLSHLAAFVEQLHDNLLGVRLEASGDPERVIVSWRFESPDEANGLPTEEKDWTKTGRNKATTKNMVKRFASTIIRPSARRS